MPAAAILYEGLPASSWPAKRIEPRTAGGRMFMIALHNVLLPMPLRPISDTGSWPI